MGNTSSSVHRIVIAGPHPMGLAFIPKPSPRPRIVVREIPEKPPLGRRKEVL